MLALTAFAARALLSFAFQADFVPYITELASRGNTPVPSGVSLAPQTF
jgi:hypothetical protein